MNPFTWFSIKYLNVVKDFFVKVSFCLLEMQVKNVLGMALCLASYSGYFFYHTRTSSALESYCSFYNESPFSCTYSYWFNLSSVANIIDFPNISCSIICYLFSWTIYNSIHLLPEWAGSWMGNGYETWLLRSSKFCIWVEKQVMGRFIIFIFCK